MDTKKMLYALIFAALLFAFWAISGSARAAGESSPGECLNKNVPVTYRVMIGDDISKIAKRCNDIPLYSIFVENPGLYLRLPLKPGQTLNIPSKESFSLFGGGDTDEDYCLGCATNTPRPPTPTPTLPPYENEVARWVSVYTVLSEDITYDNGRLLSLDEQLRNIAAYCGTTADAIRAVNPEVTRLTVGQELLIPYVYEVRGGDTLNGIAANHGVTMDAIRAINPGLVALYVGQRLSIVPSSYIIYEVRGGDTLSGIAANHGITVDAVRAFNPGLVALYVGQKLMIPSVTSQTATSTVTPTPLPPIFDGTYVVQYGDTLYKISIRAGVTIDSILAANPEILNRNLIYVGQVIKLPGTGTTSTPVTATATLTLTATVTPQTPTTTPQSPTATLTLTATVTPQPPTSTVVAQPTVTPTIQPLDLAYVPLTITYKYGMYIRSEPNGVVVASAQDDDVLYYRPGSDVSDPWGRIWVEVRLYPPRQSYITGWLMVRDQYGTFFTRPRFRP